MKKLRNKSVVRLIFQVWHKKIILRDKMVLSCKKSFRRKARICTKRVAGINLRTIVAENKEFGSFGTNTTYLSDNKHIWNQTQHLERPQSLEQEWSVYTREIIIYFQMLKAISNLLILKRIIQILKVQTQTSTISFRIRCWKIKLAWWHGGGPLACLIK